MSAIGYCRISDEDQSNNSLNNQETRIREYCINNNITLQKIFTDNGKSAFTFDRPEWIQLEKYLRANKEVRYLIVHHIDRFSRANLMDALVKLNEIEVKLKVKVLSVSDPLNLDTKDFSVQLIRSINLLFSNNERNRIQERVKDGIYRSLANGRFCNMAPHGYKNSKVDKKPLIVIDPVAAVVVKKMFDLYSSGMDLFAIGKEVRQYGFKQRNRSAIKDILTNPLYAGIIRVPVYKGQPSMEVNAIHAPIISKQVYYSIQNKLNNKTITLQKTEDVWLRGVLHCQCGRLMTAGNSKSSTGKYYWYYKCQLHQVNFSANKLHQQFKDILTAISFEEWQIDFFKQSIQKSIETHNSKKGGNIMRNKLELGKVQKKINNIQERYLQEQTIEPAIYAKVMNDLKADETRLQAELGKSKTDSDSMVAMLTDLLPMMKDILGVFENWPLHQKQLFINISFSNSLFYKDGIYRTIKLHDLFEDKALMLKEKGLLEIQQSLNFFVKTPNCIQEQTGIELLKDFINCFVA